MNWNILVVSGKNTNKYFVCTGEGMRNNFIKIFNKGLNSSLKNIKKYKEYFLKKVRVLYY